MRKIVYIIFAALIFSLFIYPLVENNGGYAASAPAEVLLRSVDDAEERLTEAYPEVVFTFDDSVHNWYKQLLFETLSLIPDEHVNNLKELKVENNELPARGMVSFALSSKNISYVKLRFNSIKFPMESGFSCSTIAECLKVTDERINKSFVGVVTHEMGHAIDLGESTKGTVEAGINPNYKDGSNPFFKDDLTVNGFYTICFSSEYELGTNCYKDDFVSQYSKTDAFEDFAETVAVYMLDGKNFWETAKSQSDIGWSTVLLEKYNFLKDKIFHGREFHLSNEGFSNSFATYDSTKRKYPLVDLLFQEKEEITTSENIE